MRNLEINTFIIKEKKVISGWLMYKCTYLYIIHQDSLINCVQNGVTRMTYIRTVHKLERMGGGVFTSPVLYDINMYTIRENILLLLL